MPIHLDVTESELQQLEIAVKLACCFQISEPLEEKIPEHYKSVEFEEAAYMYRNDNCLVVSFTGQWCPFLDHTRAFNHQPERWYIPQSSKLLIRVALEYENLALNRQWGGRAFLHTGGAFCHPSGYNEIPLLTWTLPRPSIVLRPRSA